jgi:hypothetical protein
MTMPKRKRTTPKSTEGWAATREPRGVIGQAADDQRRGLVDTDCRTRAQRSRRRRQ